jgi:hypothetical protein
MQMSTTLPMISHTADERDAFDRNGRHVHNWDAGQRKAIKSGAARRDRRTTRRTLRDPRTW